MTGAIDRFQARLHPLRPVRRPPPNLNSEAYRIARERGWDVALPLFRLNVAVHPDYANGWDSLGEALFAVGRHQEGLEGYRRAHELDPDVGNAARIVRLHQSGG